MCGIAAIVRVVRPGQGDDAPIGALRSPADPWSWHGPPVPASDVPRAPGDWLIPNVWLDAVDERIAWRGPDGAGRFRQRCVSVDSTTLEVALVHRRLSIIDHAGGAQPMLSGACRRCAESALALAKGSQHGERLIASGWTPQRMARAAVIFNGCIYNHRDLRLELQRAGHVFQSHHSDTEVLLHGWWEWGLRELPLRLDGMFAFIHWAPALARVTAGRDRFGEKPLVQYANSDRSVVVIASTASAVALGSLDGRGGSTPRVDAQAIRLWLPGDALGGSLTLLDNVHRFDPGIVPVVGAFSGDREHDGALRPIPAAAPSAEATPALHAPAAGADPVERLDQLLHEAVASRLDADVPVGCFLSSGIDSSLIAWYASRARPVLPAITVRVPDAGLDESAAASVCARALGLRHIIVDCDATNAADDLVRLIDCLGEPFSDSSILPTYWVCRAAREHVKVALSGDGGDELFMGYRRSHAVGLLRRWRWLLVALPTSRLPLARPGSRWAELHRLAVAARASQWLELEALFEPAQRAALLGPEARDLSRTPGAIVDVEIARSIDLARHLRADILRKVDTASLAAGLEVRAPFLEPHLADFALSIPARDHMEHGQTKALLRELARRRLPPGVAERPKRGFAVPISDWFRTDFGGLRTLLLDHLSADRPFGMLHDTIDINVAFVRRLLDEHWAAGGLTPLHTTRPVRRRDHGQRLFALMTLAIWARRRDRAATA